MDFAVAFVRITGLRLLMADLEALVRSDPHRRLRFLTSDYLDVTDPVALRLLLVLSEQGADVRVFTTGQTGSFHLKAYLFAQVEQGVVRKGTAFIGSSNISRSALQSGLEWNYRVIYPGDPGFLETRQQFETLFDHPQSQPLTSAWIDAYEARRLPPPRAVAPGSHEADPPPVPTKVQAEALMALSDSRERGYRRGLVVLATGLGKTWLAAFDAVSLGARKVLFVAHRDEILTQAANTFLRIWPKCRIGYYTGNFGNLLFFWDVLFGTAHITRQYPAQIGLRDDQLFGKERWWVEMFYPLFRSRREHSALVPGGKPYVEPSAPE